MPKIKSSHGSRRAPPLKDSDYDHEITLVDNSAPVPTRTLSPEPEPVSPRASTTLPAAAPPKDAAERASHPDDGLDRRRSDGGHSQPNGPSVEGRPSVSVEEPTPAANAQNSNDGRPSGPGQTPEDPNSRIDILYENERGGFLCGMALFSSKALGNLDPPAWTTANQDPSPTDIKTAQVPDPSWEWAWPEWRVNHDEGVDEGGWEYSFMFHKFSWHGPKWWNSFVRRRVWIRRRVKKELAQASHDPHLLNPEYFTIRSASRASHSRSPSRASSHLEPSKASKASRPSTSHADADEAEELAKADIEDMETLLYVLRGSSIDREKIEALDNYLAHGGDDLVHLQNEMHEIMSLFVFQASRRVLLSRLTQVHQEARSQMAVKGEDSPQLERREANLAAAMTHADEEVRQLEFWSDVKSDIEAGDAKSIADQHQGWSAEVKGLDKGGPSAPAEPKAEEPERDDK